MRYPFENNFKNSLAPGFGGASRPSTALTTMRERYTGTKGPVTSEGGVSGIGSSASGCRCPSPKLEVASPPRPPSPTLQSSGPAGLTNPLSSYEPYSSAGSACILSILMVMYHSVITATVLEKAAWLAANEKKNATIEN